MTTASMGSASALISDERTKFGVEFRTIAMIWRRELIRFARTRTRIVSSFAQPILYLFVLGYGMTSLVGSTDGFNFTKFVFPGIVSMTVVTTAIFSAISIVWDREFGFLREMLVAPVSRWSVVLGKALGGTTLATIQGTIMLALAPIIGVHLTLLLVVEVILLEALMAFALTMFGVFVASRIQKMEGFQVVMQLVLFPMIFLSGALFPLKGLPTWLAVITRFNPLTYAVDPLRHVVFAIQNMPPAAAARFATGVTIFGYKLPLLVEVAIVALFAGVFLTLAISAFGKPD